MMIKVTKTVAAIGLATSFWFANTAQAGTIKLVEVMTSPERTVALKEILSKFEADNPGIKVELTSLPWAESFEKLATMVSSGQIPDVVEMPDTWYENYAAAGYLENLDPFLEKWEHTGDLNSRAKEISKSADGHRYILPYGFYLRALFYNKKILAEAGVANPPVTTADFMAAAEKISKLPGKYAYCLRGGSGGLNSWIMFAAAEAGDNTFFTDDGRSTFSAEGWVRGLEWTLNLYRKGYAPKDSVGWGFNETVTGFYSGTCAMLDQDPDSLIAIEQRMKPEDYGVVPMPKGPAGKAFPTIGYASWSIFKEAKNKDEAFKLLSVLASPAVNVQWNQKIGSLPVFISAEKDPFYAQEKFRGWFDSLADENVIPTVMPTFLTDFAKFKESEVPRTSQQALLGKITAEQLGKQWSAFLTRSYKKQLKK